MPETNSTEAAAKQSLPGADPAVDAITGDKGSPGSSDEVDQADTGQAGKKGVGAGEGGANAGGAGNILAGVQPTHQKDGDTERRHD